MQRFRRSSVTSACSSTTAPTPCTAVDLSDCTFFGKINGGGSCWEWKDLACVLCDRKRALDDCRGAEGDGLRGTGRRLPGDQRRGVLGWVRYVLPLTVSETKADEEVPRFSATSRLITASARARWALSTALRTAEAEGA